MKLVTKSTFADIEFYETFFGEFESLSKKQHTVLFDIDHVRYTVLGTDKLVCVDESTLPLMFYKTYKNVADFFKGYRQESIIFAVAYLIKDINYQIKTFIDADTKMTLQDLVDDNYSSALIKTPIGFYTAALIKLHFIGRDWLVP